MRSFYNIYLSINLLMGKPKVCCRQREFGTFFWQGLLVLWLLSFNCYKLQYLLSTVVFFDNVVALHFYIMTRKPTHIYFSIVLKMGKPKVCCRQRETSRFFWQGLVLLWLLSFNCYKLQNLLTTVLFFDNVVALHLYMIHDQKTHPL